MPENGVGWRMMLPTHVVVGLAVAVPLFSSTPELAPFALVGALLGSVLPDLDMYVGHRRTLHYPTGYSVAAVAFGGVALIVPRPGPFAVSAAFVLLGAALHCRMDRYGGGLELRPWEGTSERAVYDHARRRWLAPKRWIRYDGAPEDLLLATAVGIPLLFVLDGPFGWLVASVLLVGAGYTLVRRRLPDLVPVVFGVLSAYGVEPVDSGVPDRYRE